MKTHEPLHGATRDVVSVTTKLMPDLAGTVAPPAPAVGRLDLLDVHSVLPGAIRGRLGIARDGSMAMESCWGDLQNTADRLAPEDLAMPFDEVDPLRNGRSSSAWAKYADAFFRVSLAVRSSRFSRSSSFSRFLDAGAAEIDNNIAGRTMRSIAIGRKNWRFAGSVAGGERAAAIYSVIETCKLNGIEPQAHIADVIEKIASGWPASRWDELMPWNWTAGVAPVSMAA